MKFAKFTFYLAGIWGLLVITPLYFIFDLIAKQDPPPITHPSFYYGFVGTALAWQLAFLVIARDPVRFRPLILPGIFEKFSYAIAILILVAQHRTNPRDLLFAATDTFLGILFLVAYTKTSLPADSR